MHAPTTTHTHTHTHRHIHTYIDTYIIDALVVVFVGAVVCRYSSPLEIIQDFFAVRLHFYELRKKHLETVLHNEIVVLQNRYRFCDAVCQGKLTIVNRTKADLLNDLVLLGIEPLDTSAARDNEPSYDYLLNAQISSLTRERLDKLAVDKQTRELELVELERLTPKDLWARDLKALRKALEKWL
jgi:DNA topoisomerase II